MSALPTALHQECSICCSSYNKCLRQRISCQYCPFEACKQCCQTFVLNDPMVRCMSPECGREWTRQYIRSVFPLTFINRALKHHRQDVLFDQERALLPATQPLVEHRIRKEELERELREARTQMLELRRRMRDLSLAIWRLDHPEITEGPHAATHRGSFVRSCPDPDCRGFLSPQWKCGLCQQWACSTCHEIKGLQRDVEHVCDPARVATAELLARDTKICPSCGEGIFRIEGCSQMFCTQCHTPFDWHTGRIITTTVHNPHYFEWMRRRDQDVGETRGGVRDVAPPAPVPVCGQEINHQFIRTANAALRRRLVCLDRHTPQNQQKLAWFCDVGRGILHIQHVELPTYGYNHELNNQALRVQYMRNRLTEEEFKKKLQIHNKRHQKNLEISQVCQLMIQTMSDILQRFYASATMTHPPSSWNGDFQEMETEIAAIVKYANECLGDISRTYESVPLQFNGRFELKPKYVLPPRPSPAVTAASPPTSSS